MDHLGSKQAQQYSQVGTRTGVDIASPHRLIQMLLAGALEKIALAKRYMLEGNIPEKGAHISWAITIISGLRGSLDAEKGGEISKNLKDLYDFMEKHLFEANLKNKPENLDEVTNLLMEIKQGWDAIADQETPAVVKEDTPPKSLGSGLSA